NKPVQVSSTLGGYHANNAVDELAKTYWSATSANKGEFIQTDLGNISTVNAVQINYADQDISFPKEMDSIFLGKTMGLFHQYIMYYSVDGKKWNVLVDKSGNKKDVPHDYVELQKPVQARYIKLENIKMPAGKFAISGLRVFGNGNGAKPKPVEGFIVLRTEKDKRSAFIKWKPEDDAFAYNIYYGTHPDKLYDNYDRAFGTGQQVKNSVSVSGGTEAVSFFSSVSQFYQKGMMPNTDYRNFSGRLNTDVVISPKFKAGVNMNFSNAGGYSYSADRFGEGLAYWSPRYDVADYLNANGTQKYFGTNNPIFGTATNKLKSDVNRFIAGANIGYDPVSWLNLSYRFGVDSYTDNRFRTAPGPTGLTGEQTYDNEQGFVGEYNSKQRTLNSTFVATLSHKLFENINGTLRLGQEIYDRKIKDVGVLGSQLTIFNFYSLGNAKVLSPSQSIRERRLVGYFGEASFDYKNYLFLTVTGRNEITSTLAADQRSFFYPSASISYVFSDQFKLPTAINQARLRLQYAQIGKDGSEYATSSGFSPYSGLPT
ncbi:MAG: hypothetical protein EOO92_21535, partial [Pedobacter sp.]